MLHWAENKVIPGMVEEMTHLVHVLSSNEDCLCVYEKHSENKI